MVDINEKWPSTASKQRPEIQRSLCGLCELLEWFQWIFDDKILVPQQRPELRSAEKWPNNQHWSCQFYSAAHWSWTPFRHHLRSNQNQIHEDSAKMCRARNDEWKSTELSDHRKTSAVTLVHDERPSQQSECDSNRDCLVHVEPQWQHCWRNSNRCIRTSWHDDRVAGWWPFHFGFDSKEYCQPVLWYYQRRVEIVGMLSIVKMDNVRTWEPVTSWFNSPGECK